MQRAGNITVSLAGQDVGRGLNPTRPISSLDMVALMRLIGDKVQDSIRHGSVSPLMEFVYASLTEGARLVEHIPIACRKGCSYCCVLWVEATPPEAIFDMKSMSPGQRARALESVEKACALTAGASFEDRCGKVNPPCPLLGADGACSAYESRPVMCRTLVSTDAERCRKTFIEHDDAGFPGPRVWLTLRDSYTTALEGALIHSGLAYRSREWNESLRVALTTPDVEQRWLSGEDDFTSAAMSPAPETFQKPLWRGIYEQAFGASPP